MTRDLAVRFNLKALKAWATGTVWQGRSAGASVFGSRAVFDGIVSRA